jgi:seryl-tRNA synthetase
MFRRKKEVTNIKKTPEMTRDDINPKSRTDENRDPPKYFKRPREEEEASLTEVLGGLLQRLKNLDKERTDLVEDIYQLGEEAEKEAEVLGRELSTLKGQTTELEKVLSAIRAHRKGVRYRKLRD